MNRTSFTGNGNADAIPFFTVRTRVTKLGYRARLVHPFTEYFYGKENRELME